MMAKHQQQCDQQDQH